MSWGTLTIGGIVFREEWTVSGEGNGTVTIKGQESHPPLPKAQVRAVHQNVVGLDGQTVPVTFSDKHELDGYYFVDSSSSEWLNDLGVPIITATWSMSLVRVGTERDIEFESRVPTIGRSEEIAGTFAPAFWHAPPVGASTYYTGATVPAGTVVRPSADGNVSVFTGIPADVAPRWTVPADSYMLGAVKLLADGYQRVGTDTPDTAVWEVNNGIIRVKPSGNGFSTEVFSGGVWESLKTYLPAVAGANVAAVPEFTVLRNEPGEVGIRLTYPGIPGRTTVDLALRRGGSFVTGVIKRYSAATLGLRRSAAEASTLQSGGMIATAVDADGNRALMLSSRLLGTTDTATPYISKASVTSFDFAAGYEVGATPGSGNTFSDLFLQYLGTTGDRTRAIRR